MRTSYAVNVSIAAALLAITSGALAATKHLPTYSGASIMANTLTGADIKNRSLASRDLVYGKVGANGAKGPQGATGKTGDTGSAGLKGAPGNAGADAGRQFSYSYRDTAGRFNVTSNPNNSSTPWYLRSSIASYVSPVFLTSSGVTMTDLGQAQNSGGVLNLTRTSDINVNATITLMHRGDERCSSDGGATNYASLTMDDPGGDSATCGTYTSHITPSEIDDRATLTRAECWAVYANANGSSALRIGESVFVTGTATEQLVNVPITAGTTLAPGSYTFRTMCRLVDRTADAQHDDWEFVFANMSVLAAADTLGS